MFSRGDLFYRPVVVWGSLLQRRPRCSVAAIILEFPRSANPTPSFNGGRDVQSRRSRCRSSRATRASCFNGGRDVQSRRCARHSRRRISRLASTEAAMFSRGDHGRLRRVADRHRASTEAAMFSRGDFISGPMTGYADLLQRRPRCSVAAMTTASTGYAPLSGFNGGRDVQSRRLNGRLTDNHGFMPASTEAAMFSRGDRGQHHVAGVRPQQLQRRPRCSVAAIRASISEAGRRAQLQRRPRCSVAAISLLLA